MILNLCAQAMVTLVCKRNRQYTRVAVFPVSVLLLTKHLKACELGEPEVPSYTVEGMNEWKNSVIGTFK